MARDAAEVAEREQARLRVAAETEKVAAENAKVAAEAARESEASQRRAAEGALLESERQRAEGLVSEGDALRIAGRLSEARARIEDAFGKFVAVKLTPFSAELALGDLNAASPPCLMTYENFKSAVFGIACSPDGRTALTANDDGTLTLWELATGRQLRTFRGHSARALCVAFSPDGRTALSGSVDHTLKLWDVESGNVVRTFYGHTGRVWGVAISADGRTAVSGSGDQTMKMWDVASGRNIRTFGGHKMDMYAVALSPDARTVLGTSPDALTMFDVESGKELSGLQERHPIVAAEFSHDGRSILTGDIDGAVGLWEVASGKLVRSFEGHHSGSVWAVAFSPDDKLAISGSDDSTVKLWDVGTGKLVRTYCGHSDTVHSVAFGPDGRTALSGSFDRTMKRWGIDIGSEARVFSGHTGEVASVVFSPDGRMGAFGGNDNSVKLWDVATGHELRSFVGHGAQVNSLVFGADGRTALSGSNDKTMRLWDVASGRLIRTFEGSGSPVAAVALGADGQRAYSIGSDCAIGVWDAQSGKLLRTFSVEANAASAGFSPDFGTVLCGDRDGRLKLWDVGSGRLVRTFAGHQYDIIFDVEFSADGKRALTASRDRSVMECDVLSGRPICLLRGNATAVMRAMFGPGAGTAYTLGRDGIVKVWDLKDGHEIRAYGTDGGMAESVAVRPDGRAILCGNDNGSLTLREFDRAREYEDFQKKVDGAQKALQNDATDASAIAVLGEWWAYRGIDDWAVESLEKARNGGAAVSNLMLGRCYWNLKRFAEARREFTAAMADANDEGERFYLRMCVEGIDAGENK